MSKRKPTTETLAALQSRITEVQEALQQEQAERLQEFGLIMFDYLRHNAEARAAIIPHVVKDLKPRKARLLAPLLVKLQTAQDTTTQPPAAGQTLTEPVSEK